MYILKGGGSTGSLVDLWHFWPGSWFFTFDFIFKNQIQKTCLPLKVVYYQDLSPPPFTINPSLRINRAAFLEIWNLKIQIQIRTHVMLLRNSKLTRVADDNSHDQQSSQFIPTISFWSLRFQVCPMWAKLISPGDLETLILLSGVAGRYVSPTSVREWYSS